MAYKPNPTIVTTQSGNYNVQSAQRKYDVSKAIARYMPDAAPFTVLLKNLNSASVIDSTFKVLEEQPQPWADAVNAGAGYTAAALTFVVDHSTYFKAQDLIKNERTGEVMKVTTVTTATNTLTVIRSYGTTAAAIGLDNDPIRILGGAYEDGSAMGAVRMVKVDSNTNYTQRFKEPIQLPDTIMNTDLYGEPELQRLRKSKGIAHLIKIENALLFGEKAIYNPVSAGTFATTAEECRATAGLLSWISSNVKTLGDGSLAGGGSLTEADFNTWLEDVMKFPGGQGSAKRTLFASPRLCSVIDGWGRDKLQTVPSDETYGIAVKEYKSSHGVINIIKHPLLDGAYYGSYGIVADMKNVGYRYLQGLDTKLYVDISNRATTSGQVDQYESECGLYLALEALHGVIKGVNS